MPCRGAQQRIARARYADLVVKRLHKRLNNEPELTRMHSTNRLYPLGSLKQRRLRALFGGWTSKFVGKGRIFTGALSKQVCMELRSRFGMDTHVPKDEAVRLRSLLQVARKRKLAPLKVKAMATNPDTMETLPMEFGEDCACFWLSLTFSMLFSVHQPPLVYSPSAGHAKEPWMDFNAGTDVEDHECLGWISVPLNTTARMFACLVSSFPSVCIRLHLVVQPCFVCVHSGTIMLIRRLNCIFLFWLQRISKVCTLRIPLCDSGSGYATTSLHPEKREE